MLDIYYNLVLKHQRVMHSVQYNESSLQPHEISRLMYKPEALSFGRITKVSRWHIHPSLKSSPISAKCI